MSKLTLDEAIKHCLEAAEEQSKLYSQCPLSCNGMKDCLCLEHGKGKGCVRLADNYKQLAEWLTELKELRSLKTDYVFFKAEAKKLLKAAVEDFSNMYDHIYYCDGICDTCPLHGERDNCLVWQHANEAEKLLKEDNHAE